VKDHLQNKPSFAPTSISRRRFMQAALAVPVLLTLSGRAFASANIHQLRGEVFINNRPASLGSRISAGNKIVVSHDGELVFSIGGDAFLLRGGTALELVGSSVISGLRLLTGSLLGAFDKRKKPAHIVTSVATIGIRGTAVYVSAEPHRLYTCTCYGETDLRIGRHRQQINANYHTAHEIVKDPTGKASDKMAGMALNSMDVIDHTDDELRMLESLVGRVPAFDRQP
jgi:hypothetical protein